MRAWVEVKPYGRNFLQPLKTAHGLWWRREGILVKVRGDSGVVAFGEVAPIPWFGTETLAMAQEFWQSKTCRWLSVDDLAVPDALSATQFAVGTALVGLQRGHLTPPLPLSNRELCGLLPAGKKALEDLPNLLAQGFCTLKWKVGVYSLSEELHWLEILVSRLPENCQLRLDANGGLTLDQAEQWLAQCDQITGFDTNPDVASGRIEYLEQPLPPERLQAMQELSRRFQTKIALDESVATLTQMEMCDRQGWSGLYVIKPVIAGAPPRLQTFLAKLGQGVRFSSGFETVIGRQAALHLALDHCLQTFPRGALPALGFGTLNFFDDDWDQLTAEQLWEKI